jgi:hypothetical protein
MSFSNWWDDMTNQSTISPKSSKSLRIKKSSSLGPTVGNIGAIGGTNVITSTNVPQGQSIYVNPNTANGYASTSAWNTTAGTYSTSTWDNSVWENAIVPDLINEVLVSLGFVENKIENSYEMDLKTMIRIPKYKLAQLNNDAAQRLIIKYLEEMKKKVIDKVTEKIVIGNLINLDKLSKDPNIHEC